MAALKVAGFAFPALNELKHLAVVGLSLLGVANGSVVYAEQWIPSGLAALLISTLPFWVVGIESFSPSGIKPNKKVIIGVLIGLFGSTLIFRNELDNLLDADYLNGIIAIVFAMIFWASGSLYSQRRKFTVHPLMGASFQMLIAGIAQTIVGIVMGEWSAFTFTTSSLGAFLYLVFVGSLLGYAAYIYALAHLPASFATTYAYINPVIALFLGWFVLDEKLSWIIGIATIIILGGVAIVKQGSKEAENQIT